jgi:hypothetical protein
MEKFFVSHEVALKLKRLGFNLDCISHFRGKDIEPTSQMGYDFNYDKNYDFNDNTDYWITRPLIHQVVDWLEDEYDIEMDVMFIRQLNKYHFIIEKKSTGLHLVDFLDFPHFEGKYECYNLGLLESLKLVENENNRKI